MKLTILFAWTARHPIALGDARHGDIGEHSCGCIVAKERGDVPRQVDRCRADKLGFRFT